MQLGLPASLFDELLFNTLDSIYWQSIKVADQLKKGWQQGKQNQKKGLPCQKLIHLIFVFEFVCCLALFNVEISLQHQVDRKF